jgi:hypothetical protein
MASRTWVSTSDGNFGTAANWAPSGAPASGDVLTFDGTGTANVTAGLDQSALTGVTVRFEHASAVEVGAYAAGVPSYLKFGTGLTVVVGGQTGFGSGSGSPRLMIHGTGAATVNIVRAASAGRSDDANVPPVQLKGADLTIAASGGSFGVGVRAGETGNVVTSLHANLGSDGDAPYCYLGPGTAVTSQTINAGRVYSRSDGTAAATVVDGGEYDYEGTGAHTALTVNNDSTCYYSGTGTITAGIVAGELNFSRDGRTKTVTNLTVSDGATLDVDNGVPGSIVFTNAIQYPDGMENVTIRTPGGVKGTLTNI